MENFEALVAGFTQPPAEASACPFWFWNDALDPNELVRQLHLMYEQGVRACAIHARKGLQTPYLSDEWFACCRVVIVEAARLGMKLWIYDEENWASGYAGGRVVARDEAFRGQNLHIERHYVQGPSSIHIRLSDADTIRAVTVSRIANVAPLPDDPLRFHGESDATTLEDAWTDRTRFEHTFVPEPPRLLYPPAADTVLQQTDNYDAVWHVQPDTERDATLSTTQQAPDAVASLLLTGEVAEGRWLVLVARQAPTDWQAAYSDYAYIDLMNAQATEVFLAETHARYYQHFAPYFGTTILGFFVDEPAFYNNFWDRNVGSLTWTHDFATQFMQRRGYDILSWLPALWENLGEMGAQVRFDYWRTVAELLHERFFGKLAAWCQAHDVWLTGHLEWEEWLFTMTRASANPFTALAPFHVPGVDRIDEVYEKLAEKLIASVAHAHGRPRVASETFALTGWKLAPPYMKQIVDYQYVRGINWLFPHAFYYSIADYRQRECPPSEFFQNPWWEHSRPLWDYIARLSAALTRGAHVAPVALYYPIEHAWVSMTPETPGAFDGGAWARWQLPERDTPVQRTDLHMLDLGLRLLNNQYDFDFVDHTTLLALEPVEAAGAEEHDRRSARADALTIGQERFRALLVPPVATLAAGVLSQMLAFAQAGGVLIFIEELPTHEVGDASDKDTALWMQTWPELRGRLAAMPLPDVVAWGAGQVGFVPAGGEAAVALLRSLIQPDVEVRVLPDDERLVVSLEERSGPARETRMRSIASAVSALRRHGEDYDLYFLVNESEQTFTASVRLVGGADIEEWQPETGKRQRYVAHALADGRVEVMLDFVPHQSHLLVLRPSPTRQEIDTTSSVSMLAASQTHRSFQIVRQQPLLDWTVHIGEQVWQETGRWLRGWSERGLPFYSGHGVYETTFVLDTPLDRTERLMLDLGVTLETAQVRINGHALPTLAFAPYQVDITTWTHSGVESSNTLEIVVANTNANAFERQERPSGLLGPVRLLTLQPGVPTAN